MGKTIIFDIDDTLYSYTDCIEKASQVMGNFSQEMFGWEAGEWKKLWVEKYHEAIDELGYDNVNIHDTMLRIQKMLEHKGVNPLPYARMLHILFWDTVVEHMVPFDGVIAFIQEAKAKGYCLGIATDLTVEIQFRKLEKLGLTEWIDFVVTSEEAGCEKPHKGVFELCMKKAGALPEECLMIGDNRDRDIAGALAMGMRAAWHVPGKSPEDIDEQTEGLIVFHDYKSLYGVL